MTTRARHMARMPLGGRPLAGTVKDGETTIHTVCMVCGTTVKHGPKVDGRSSHGLCGHSGCERITTEPVTELMLEQLADAARMAHGRYMRVPGEREDPAVREAFETSDRAWRRFRTALGLVFRKNDPAGGASQRAGSERGRPSGDDDFKVAGAAADGNSGRSEGPYVVEVGSPGGTVARYRYPDFDAMLADVDRVAELHRGPMAFGNEDRADPGHDGLTDAECERLEGVLHG